MEKAQPITREGLTRIEATILVERDGQMGRFEVR